MKVEIRESEVELIAETEHERDALAKLHRAQTITVKAGRTTDTAGWPPDLRKTNAVLCLPDPNDWGS